MKYIDLTHTFTSSMPVYPGDVLPQLKPHAVMVEDGHNDFQITTGMHVGTHIDGPFHMLSNGKLLSEFPVEHFFGVGHLIDARDKIIDGKLFEGKSIKKGDIVLLYTGLSEKFRSPEYCQTYPEITAEFTLKMIELGVKIVGMDMPSPDRPPFTIHKLLLARDILIIENLTNLEALLGCEKFKVVALPTKFETDSAPVRVVAELV